MTKVITNTNPFVGPFEQALALLESIRTLGFMPSGIRSAPSGGEFPIIAQINGVEREFSCVLTVVKNDRWTLQIGGAGLSQQVRTGVVAIDNALLKRVLDDFLAELQELQRREGQTAATEAVNSEKAAFASGSEDKVVAIN